MGMLSDGAGYGGGSLLRSRESCSRLRNGTQSVQSPGGRRGGRGGGWRLRREGGRVLGGGQQEAHDLGDGGLEPWEGGNCPGTRGAWPGGRLHAAPLSLAPVAATCPQDCILTDLSAATPPPQAMAIRLCCVSRGTYHRPSLIQCLVGEGRRHSRCHSCGACG